MAKELRRIAESSHSVGRGPGAAGAGLSPGGRSCIFLDDYGHVILAEIGAWNPCAHGLDYVGSTDYPVHSDRPTCDTIAEHCIY